MLFSRCRWVNFGRWNSLVKFEKWIVKVKRTCSSVMQQLSFSQHPMCLNLRSIGKVNWHPMGKNPYNKFFICICSIFKCYIVWRTHRFSAMRAHYVALNTMHHCTWKDTGEIWQRKQNQCWPNRRLLPGLMQLFPRLGSCPESDQRKPSSAISALTPGRIQIESCV